MLTSAAAQETTRVMSCERHCYTWGAFILSGDWR